MLFLYNKFTWSLSKYYYLHNKILAMAQNEIVPNKVYNYDNGKEVNESYS